MNRRKLLKYLLGMIGGFILGSKPKYIGGAPAKLLEEDTAPLFCGWIDDVKARKAFVQKNKYAFLSQMDGQIKGTGKGQAVFLWKYFERITGSPLVTHYQEIGDCVAHAFGLGTDVLTAVQILMHMKPERWITKCATELIYAGSRVEVGGGKIRGDGSMGVWAAEFIKNWGVLLQLPYLDGAYDFTKYSGYKARQLGNRGAGVPDELEPLCKLHPVKTCAIVRSWEECRDAVANGYPVAMCSNVGFNSHRDKDGFLLRSRRPWYHAMIILGIDDAYQRPGALVQNSWGVHWVSGPTRHNQPEGSFWADASTIDAALRQGDSIALSGYIGYPRVKIPDYQIW
jgi:hypothetical protein